MLSFPNCKINLGLHVLRKRADGFHDIETVFYPLIFTDALEIIYNPEKEPNSSQAISFTSSGIPLQLSAEENICVKAYYLLKKDFPQLAPVKMHLHKIIPTGAGLGGGSADGAYTLKLLNEKFILGLNKEQLNLYALQLGSDCPFFIFNKPSFATGQGEILEEINVDLSNYKIVLINPGIHLNTKWAFSQITPALPNRSIKEIILQPVETWKNSLINDFEIPVFQNHPEIRKIKTQLYSANAEYASMTGSGSTLFGIFKKETATSFTFPKHYFIKELHGKLQ
ncbi:MAG: 4-(cytidine 5'-diphospho)-2-C-methyl-D-erythritol kinase [Bacteroidetes bacterium]|nr:4-(cytidine 5'-diphospho)-2-C-methyl-D-erythritol kinase [Bacteroidota bacterium]MBS1930650.1 4-(cytidine 5'-diphospho)-2-C-methyl-D-erythritol kinase [Bacteroidota bacterium]